MKNVFLACFCCFFLSFNSINATHIISGTMAYECLGNESYQVTLILYRDCFNGIPHFDNPAAIAIYSDGNLHAKLQITLESNDTLIYDPYANCEPNSDIHCVEKGVYTFTINLPISNSEYSIVYQRCCWAENIVNIDSPGGRGITVTTNISPLAQTECNTQNLIEFPLSFAACPDEPVSIPLDGFDPEGDSLVYELCFPFEGGGLEGSVQFPGDPFSCVGVSPTPPCPPPFNQVPYALGFDEANPFPTVDGISFNANTGALEFIPAMIGRFIYGICITEYRDGQVLGVYSQTLELANVITSVTSVKRIDAPLSWKTTYAQPSHILKVLRDGTPVEGSITIFNTDGQLVQKQFINNRNEVIFHTHHLSTGIYIIHIKEGSQTQVIKTMIW